VHRLLQHLCKSVTIVAERSKLYLAKNNVRQRFYLKTIIMRKPLRDEILKILIIKAYEMHYFSILFRQSTLHILDRSTVHHQESQHCVHSYRYLSCLFCWLSASEVRTSQADSKQTGITNTYCCVYSVETPDDGYICPKHVGYIVKIKFRISTSRWILL
jgi:hypothetical protein